MHWRDLVVKNSGEGIRETVACQSFVKLLSDPSTWSHITDHHPLLVEALRLYCLNERPRHWPNAPMRTPAPPELIDKLPYMWYELHQAVDIRLRDAVSLAEVFRPLKARSRLSHLDRGRFTRHPIVLAPSEICSLVLGDQRLIGRAFVLLGPWGLKSGHKLNFGALPRGYDHGCSHDPRAQFSACMLERHFANFCPNATLGHVHRLLVCTYFKCARVFHSSCL